MAPTAVAFRPLSPSLTAYLAAQDANYSPESELASSGMASWVGTPLASLGTARQTWGQTPADRLVLGCDLLPDLANPFAVTPENQVTLDAVAVELDALIAELGARTPLRQLLVASA